MHGQPPGLHQWVGLGFRVQPSVVAPAKFTFQFGHPKSESPSTLLEQLNHIRQQTLALVTVKGRWSAHEIDLVDWVFNSGAVLRERANLMDQHEGLTYERDAVHREKASPRPFPTVLVRPDCRGACVEYNALYYSQYRR
jgi:hypothetical protein